MPNVAPTVTPIDQTLFVNAFINISDLFTVSDADGDAITQYRFLDFDSNSLSGRLEVDGQLQINGNEVTINANQLASTFYLAGSAIRREGIRIQAFDGELWSDPTEFAIAYTTQQNITKPNAVVSPITVLGNEFVQADTFISANDPDGFPILRYRIRDRKENNSFFRLGDQRLEAGVFHTIEADQLSEMRYYGFGRPTDQIDVFAFDGAQFSDFATAAVTTQLNENRPTVVFDRFRATERTAQTLSEKSLPTIPMATRSSVTV